MHSFGKFFKSIDILIKTLVIAVVVVDVGNMRQVLYDDGYELMLITSQLIAFCNMLPMQRRSAPFSLISK